MLVLDLQDAPAGGVDEVAVVGNHQQGTGVLLQPLLQPQGRVQVQVIGRLVQQQHIRGRHQCPGQVEANTPAAGEVPHRPPGGVRVETQALQQALGPPLGTVTVHVLQLAVHASHRVVVAGRLLPLQLVPQGRQRAVPAPDILSRRQAGGVYLLRHVGETQPGHALDLTGIGNQFPQQQGEQARFATAVGADQGQPLTGLDGNAGALQQQFAAPAQPDIAKYDHEAGHSTCRALAVLYERPIRAARTGRRVAGEAIRAGWRKFRLGSKMGPHCDTLARARRWSGLDFQPGRLRSGPRSNPGQALALISNREISLSLNTGRNL